MFWSYYFKPTNSVSFIFDWKEEQSQKRLNVFGNTLYSKWIRASFSIVCLGTGSPENEIGYHRQVF